jgi:hypothetical protein
MKTTASKITIEISFNNQLEFITYTDTTVWQAMKQLKKKYGEVYIFDIKTKY